MDITKKEYFRTYAYRPVCHKCKKRTSSFVERGGFTFCLGCDPVTKMKETKQTLRDVEYERQLRLSKGLKPTQRKPCNNI